MGDLAPNTECVIALDVGGTSMKGAVRDRASRAVTTLRTPTPSRLGPDAVVQAITQALRALAAQAARRNLAPVAAGVVVPGIVDEPAQLAVESVNLGWRNVPLAALLTDALGLPVVLGHDVRAGGAAEHRLGAASGANDALFVAIGTGISAAVIADGRLLRAHGHAGELGHLPVAQETTRCACGGVGCLEAVASARAIASAYTARSGRPVDGAEGVVASAAHGDPDACRVWERAIDALAQALTVSVSLLGPEVIVIGGGLSEAGSLLLDPLRTALGDRLGHRRRPEVVRAALGSQAGCVGAGLAAWEVAGAPLVPSGPDGGGRA
ncbi:ROK family protein [Streptomyces sp. enrichment culture]|uniref:ROK family protein n=1 Tax=Streptomyces sp. enrichment culture TaxID=1795815 RepID=UPI003F56D30E